MSAAPVQAAPTPFPQLTAAQRRAAAAALADVAEHLARELGRSPRDLAVIASAAAAQLALAGDTWLLLVEHPMYATREQIPRARNTVGAGGFGRHQVGGEELEDLFCAGELRPHALREGLELLAAADGPESVLASRRAELAQRRRRDAEEKAARAEADRQRALDLERWKAANADRIAAWERVPLEIQRLHVAADRMPEHRPLLMLLAELASVPPQMGFSLPESFKPELARK